MSLFSGALRARTKKNCVSRIIYWPWGEPWREPLQAPRRPRPRRNLGCRLVKKTPCTPNFNALETAAAGFCGVYVTENLCLPKPPRCCMHHAPRDTLPSCSSWLISTVLSHAPSRAKPWPGCRLSVRSRSSGPQWSTPVHG